MLESSALLDERANDKRREEAEKTGNTRDAKMGWHGKSYQVIDLPIYSYSLGITLSAQILAGQAAELALKYAFEIDHSDRSAPPTHELGDLYSRLSQERKLTIEDDYSRRKHRHDTPQICGWQSAQELFLSATHYPVLFRYATEEGQPPYEVHPIFLREAICSVLSTLGINVRWGSRQP